MKILQREFYMQDTLTVAKELLGKYIVRKADSCEIISRIVETEAYLGPEDKAAHSYKGRRTERNEIMYGMAGYVYVFMIYGMYYCLNAVTSEVNKPEAVLVRAVEPVSGLDYMALNRFGVEYNRLNSYQLKNLTNGPGKLCKALDIDRSLNGADLCSSSEISICRGIESSIEIGTSPRIGIDYAEEYKDMPWRFFLKGNTYVSYYKKGG
ncbi:MAG: DNA-3-methyladenine glycosylase [Bacillota bacterium]